MIHIQVMCPMFSLPTVLAETLHLYEQIKGSQELLHGSKIFVRFYHMPLLVYKNLLDGIVI